ncbi:MAG: hypothetical protein AAGJ40_14770 [Planctomycetota bacterium]
MSLPRIGGVIHAYQKYDPSAFPPPTQEPPDLVSSAFEQAMMYGNMRELTDEELANAVKLDPSQIANLGPSIDFLRGLLEDRKRKILETYETKQVQKRARKALFQAAKRVKPPPGKMESMFRLAVNQEQPYLIERLWYQAGDDQGELARALLATGSAMQDKHLVEELATKYEFTGNESMTVPQAIEIKEELEKLDELLDQLAEAEKTAQIGVIDMEALSEFAEPGDMQQLEEMRQQIENMMREQAERQGLERNQDGSGYRLTPKAYKVFQGRLLERIFSELDPSRTGRHEGDVVGEGAVELQQTKPYEFGDSIANMDMPQTVVNALLRQGDERPIRLRSDDIVVHKTRNHPKCATAVVMDMSGSMRYDGQYMNVKRMALAMQGLINTEYPGDFLRFIEMYTFAKLRQPGEIIELMPKTVTIHDPWVRLKCDMSDEDITEQQIHPHFTNIQHALQLARQNLINCDTPNRQIMLITDGLPTAHFEDEWLYMLYPPDPQTEAATMREAQLCKKEDITINIFLIPSWSQNEEDIRFAYRMAQATSGRVFFTSGKNLDRFVLWDYVKNRREIIS